MQASKSFLLTSLLTVAVSGVRADTLYDTLITGNFGGLSSDTTFRSFMPFRLSQNSVVNKVSWLGEGIVDSTRFRVGFATEGINGPYGPPKLPTFFQKDSTLRKKEIYEYNSLFELDLGTDVFLYANRNYFFTVMNLTPDLPPPPATTGHWYWSGIPDTPNCCAQTRLPDGQFVLQATEVAFALYGKPKSPLSLIKSETLLATVAGSHVEKSPGTALGEIGTSVKGTTYGERNRQLIECDPTTCDFDQIAQQQRQEFLEFDQNLGQVAADLGSDLITAPIGMSSVDMSTFDSTLLGKAINFTDFVTGIKSKLKNSVDFIKSLKATGSSQSLQRASLFAASDEIIVNSISGTMIWDADSDPNWLLFDIELNVDISKEYFPDIGSGQLFATDENHHPNLEGFGVFKVLDLVDPAGYNTVNLSYRHLDFSPTPVPLPGSAIFLAGGAALLGAAIRRVRSPLPQHQ